MREGSFPPPLSELDAKNPESIEDFGRRAIGRTSREIIASRDPSHPLLRVGRKATKGDLGDAMEVYYGIRKNSRSEPDFPQAKVELKTLPLKRLRGRGHAVKEPTSISMIHYPTLPSERWATASVREKLGHVIFAVFSVDQNDLLESKLHNLFLWEPRSTDWELFGSDWGVTKSIVAESRAEALSERQAIALAARRKGRGGPTDVGTPQYNPRSDPTIANAPSRAWALKTHFTRQLYQERTGRGPTAFASALVGVHPGPPGRVLDPVEEKVLAELRPFRGLPLKTLVAVKRLGGGGGKSLASRMVHRALGVDPTKRIREFEQTGYLVRTLNLQARNGWPYEAVSFPVVDLCELMEQEWEPRIVEDETGKEVTTIPGSDLSEQVRRILFVPTFAPKRKTSQLDRMLGNPFFWTPSGAELEGIRLEWEMYRREVAQGKAAYHRVPGKRERENALTKPFPEGFIHVRPHGRNAEDTYKDPKGNWVTKQCFWLNKEFIYRILEQNDALPHNKTGNE